MIGERLIMVIEGREARGQNLKELIEFMDAPRVRIAAPDNWLKRLGDCRLAAIFLGDDLEPDVIDGLITDVGEIDPNTPIVMVSADGVGH
ncbi:MAG: hypothetical protein GXP15_01125 [Gammaproteobacteria bacterium]|nr:hypothetical protein [Gammaproteobacteria bacterium]